MVAAAEPVVVAAAVGVVAKHSTNQLLLKYLSFFLK